MPARSASAPLDVEVCGSGARVRTAGSVSGRAFVWASPVGRSTHVTLAGAPLGRRSPLLAAARRPAPASAAPAARRRTRPTAAPARAAADWIEGELEAKDGMLTISFGGPDEFADWGLTIDAILALAAGRRADDAAATDAPPPLVEDQRRRATSPAVRAPTDRAAGASPRRC